MSAAPGFRTYRVLVVGCGQLGSRHLQAISTLPQVTEVDVVDPRPEALELGRARLAEVADRAPTTKFQWFASVDQASHGGDLCIVATQALGRAQVVQQVVERLGYRAFLLEKIVTQSTAEYEGLLRLAAERRLSVWVNCKTRAHPSHRRVKASLEAGEPIILGIVAGNQGLANNGIHMADLFAFYDGSTRIDPAGSRVDPILHPSKRGRDVFDLSGTLLGVSPKGSHFSLSFSAHHDSPMCVTVASPRYRAVIDDMLKWFHESTAESGWTWRRVPFEANLMVSAMTRLFASQILAFGRCELPTLEECYPAHRFILEELRPHFTKLLGKPVERCPVT